MSRFLAFLLIALLAASPALAAGKATAVPADKTPVATADKTYEQKIKAHPFYASILETSQTKQGRELLEYFDASVAVDASRLPVISYWLRDNSINVDDPAKINVLYFLSYSDTLAAMAEGYKASGDPDQYRSLYKTAMLNLHIFELMGTVDSARCQDPTVGDAVKTMVTARLDSLTTGYKMFPRDVIEQIEKSALREEEKNLSRPVNVDLCSMGQARIIDLSKTPGVTEKKVQDPRFPNGRTVYVPPAGYIYSPAIAPDDEWLKLRKNVLVAVTKNWAKRYEDAVR